MHGISVCKEPLTRLHILQPPAAQPIPAVDKLPALMHPHLKPRRAVQLRSRLMSDRLRAVEDELRAQPSSHHKLS